MTPRRHSPTLPVALAIAAALWVLGAAPSSVVACSPSNQGEGRGCCATKASTDCGCCRPSDAKAALAAVPAAPSLVRPSDGEEARTTAAAASLRSCGCRAGEPAAPASRPRTIATSDGVDAHLSPATAPAPAFRAVAHTPRPGVAPSPGRPLYLRTSRLLI